MKHLEIYCNYNAHNGIDRVVNVTAQQPSTAIYEHEKEVKLHGTIEAE